MPHLNLKNLVTALHIHRKNLYQIYINTTNLTISDSILQEHEYICQIILELESLLRP